MNASHSPVQRGPAIWYAYLMNGFLTYFFNIQGNIVPFLRDELHLSYRAVSFHSSALAVGVLVIGLIGDRAMRRFGRQRSYWLGSLGIAAGAILICAAPNAWMSIPGFALIGLFGGLIPVVVVAVTADVPPNHRAVVYAESSIMAYVFALMAPLLTGLSLALALDWRSPLIAGMAAGAIILLIFRATPLPARPAPDIAHPTQLPLAYWAYWALLALGVAMEFSVILWSPEFLERVVGMSRGAAATGAAAFFAAMLLGRIVGSRLLRTMPARTLYLVALVLTFVGFLVYWGLSGPVAAISGLFVLGLGIAQCYPLSATLAVGAAGGDADKASARMMSAVGLALIATPPLMGGLADAVGLRLAHLVLPVLVAAAFGTLALARSLERRALVLTPG